VNLGKESLLVKGWRPDMVSIRFQGVGIVVLEQVLRGKQSLYGTTIKPEAECDMRV
jgi:hypothetical protein